MRPEDIQYLRAELAQAQQQGLRSIQIRTPELQSLISRLDRAIAAAPAGFKIFGFVHPREAVKFRAGDISKIKTSRSITVDHTKAVFIGVDE